MGEDTQANPDVPQPPTEPAPPQPDPEADPSRTEEGEKYDGGEIPQVDAPEERLADEDEVA